MTKLDAIRAALENPQPLMQGMTRQDVAWLVERLDEATGLLRAAQSILVLDYLGDDVSGAAQMFPNAVRVNGQIAALLARLEEPES